MSIEHDDEFSKERAIVKLEEMYRFEEGDSHEPKEDDLARRRYVDAVLAASGTHRPEVSLPGTRSRGRRLVAIGVGAVGLIAASVAAVMLVGGREEPARSHESPHVATAGPSFRLAAGSAEVGEIARTELGRRIEDGEVVTVGEDGALFSMDGRIALLARRGSRLRVRAEANRIDVRLEAGAILANVDPTAHAPGLIVATPAGRVEVTGTVFTVFADSAGSVVEVFRGSVDVSAGANHTGVVAGEALDTRAGELAIAADRVGSVLLGADAILEMVQGRGAAQAEIGMFDGLFDRGNPVPSGASAATASAAGAIGGRPRSGAPVTARQLLEAARAARKNHDWKGAADEYRTLVQRFPDAGEAGVALVDLGSIQLDRLGQPEAALASFDRYLRTNGTGSLAAEASWGRAKALKALGRAQEEKAALVAFVARFPDSFQAAEAHQRLSQLN
jgi:hypothetical protein